MNELQPFQPSYARTMIRERFAKLAIDNIVTYEELGALVGKDVGDEKQLRHIQNVCRGVVWKILKDEGFYIDNIEKVGYKRLSSEESVGVTEEFISKIRRSAKRASKVAASIDYDQLSDEGRKRLNINLTKAGTILHFTSAATTKKIEAAVVKNQKSIPVLEAMESFKGS